jgi:hypothetical protein
LFLTGEIDSFLATEEHETPASGKKMRHNHAPHHNGEHRKHHHEIDAKYLFSKFFKLFKGRAKDFLVVFVYASMVGLMSLVVSALGLRRLLIQ